MKIYTKIVFDTQNKIVEEKYFDYSGPLTLCGIHYDFKSTRGAKAMAKAAKREKKLAEKKSKREAKEGPKKDISEKKSLDPNQALSLDFITNPNKE
jgi:hypothetical protein